MDPQPSPVQTGNNPNETDEISSPGVDSNREPRKLRGTENSPAMNRSFWDYASGEIPWEWVSLVAKGLAKRTEARRCCRFPSTVIDHAKQGDCSANDYQPGPFVASRDSESKRRHVRPENGNFDRISCSSRIELQISKSDGLRFKSTKGPLQGWMKSLE